MIHLWKTIVVLTALLVASQANAQDEITIEARQFGVGGMYRPGSVTAIRLNLTSNLSEPTSVWVQVELPNADGDLAEYGRSIGMAPGDTRLLWIYVPLPPDYEGEPLLVRAFEENGVEHGKSLGGTRISGGANGRVAAPISMIGGVTTDGKTLFLRQYSNQRGLRGTSLFANEDTQFVGFGINDLPDRWEGLLGFEAIAWNGARVSELKTPEGEALLDYIQRGGHFVVSLANDGLDWPIGNPSALGVFGDLMPVKAPLKEPDGVALGTLLQVTSKHDATGLPAGLATKRIEAHTFGNLLEDGCTAENYYDPLIALDDGRILAVQRTFGFGRITILGLDLASTDLTTINGAVQADTLWNRILGRRIDTPSARELAEIETARRLQRSLPAQNAIGGGQLIQQLTNLSKQATRGLLVAFVLFIAYWVVAGPGGFIVLKQYRLERHAWLAFAAAAAIFTGAAWGIVSVIRPAKYELKHVTFMDMIARPEGDRVNADGTPDNDPQLRRAVSFFSLYLPGYQRRPVFLESMSGQRDLLYPWQPPGVLVQPFPNPDRFTVDVGGAFASLGHYQGRLEEHPDYRRPSRATTTQFYAHCLGALDPSWQSKGFSVGAGGIARNSTDQLVGTLTHDLPGTLEDVLVIWVKNERVRQRRYQSSDGIEQPWIAQTSSGNMNNVGGMWSISDWLAGDAFDLVQLDDSGSGLSRQIEKSFVDSYRDKGLAGAVTGTVGLNDQRRFLQMLCIFDQLTPPKYVTLSAGDMLDGQVNFYRLLGRELDLSGWFTRPCLIVIGIVRGATNPVPVRVEGESPAIDAQSTTVVRWIHPLPVEDDVAFYEVFQQESEQDG